MFHIASQSITLLPDPDKHEGETAPLVLNFDGRVGHDTSKCILTVTTPDGDQHTVSFNRGGTFVGQTFAKADDLAEDDDHPVLTGNYMVDGRDTRADDPYTHVAPAMHGDPIVPYAGGLQPDTFDADGKPAITPEMREHALEEAAARARGDRDEKESEEHDEGSGDPEGVFGTHQTPSPGPSPFETAPQPVNPPLRNPMMTDHGKVNTTESIRNG